MHRQPGPAICSLLLVLAVGVLASGCEKTTTTVTTGPTPIKCAVTLNLNQGMMPAAGATGSVAVGTTPECAWTGVADVPWITSLSPASGQGPGQIQFQVTANPGPTLREGQIIVNDIGTRVTQAGTACQVAIDPTSQSFPSAGGAGGVAVTTIAGCAWSASSNAPWLVITSATSGNGPGTVTYTVGANTGVARVGVITIADQTFVVTQLAPVTVPCTNTISPTSQALAAGGGQVAVSITAIPSCSWTAASNVSWLAISGVGVGAGNGSVTVVAAPNTGAARTGTATIAGETFTVNQAGSCLSSIAPTSQSMPIGGGTATPVGVTIATGCAWTATTSTPWITITKGASGNGDGVVEFTIAANPGGPRSGTLSIAGHTHTVNQAGSCAAQINPTNQSIGSGGGAGTPINVTAPAGCAWTATTTDAWINITSGGSGSGPGTVNFTVVANAGPARTGTISVAGQTFTVNQASGCTVSINPSSQSIGAPGGSGVTINVTSQAGCGWTATTTDTWITITTGESGIGPGTVTYTVANNTGAARVGTINVGGQTFTVNQAALCSVTINPGSQTVGPNGGAAANVNVSAAGSCAWTAVPNVTWITITNGSPDTGNGTVQFTVAANTGAQRVGTITINNQTHTVTQNAPPPPCTYSINPTSMSMPANQMTSSPVTITTQAGCAWTSVPNVSWLTIQTGASGSGNGTMTFRTQNNNSSSPRTGTITIAGQTFTVTQAGQ